MLIYFFIYIEFCVKIYRYLIKIKKNFHFKTILFQNNKMLVFFLFFMINCISGNLFKLLDFPLKTLKYFEFKKLLKDLFFLLLKKFI